MFHWWEHACAVSGWGADPECQTLLARQAGGRRQAASWTWAAAPRRSKPPWLILSFLVWGQAGADPEFQALLARQAGEDGGDADAGGLTAQEKGAGLASVFKRDDSNLAARCPCTA